MTALSENEAYRLQRKAACVLKGICGDKLRGFLTLTRFEGSDQLPAPLRR